MPVTIDEVTAEVATDRAATPASSSEDQNRDSPGRELRRYRELQNRCAIRAARLRVE
jgi:hypothetical protein